MKQVLLCSQSCAVVVCLLLIGSMTADAAHFEVRENVQESPQDSSGRTSSYQDMHRQVQRQPDISDSRAPSMNPLERLRSLSDMSQPLYRRSPLAASVHQIAGSLGLQGDNSGGFYHQKKHQYLALSDSDFLTLTVIYSTQLGPSPSTESGDSSSSGSSSSQANQDQASDTSLPSSPGQMSASTEGKSSQPTYSSVQGNLGSALSKSTAGLRLPEQSDAGALASPTIPNAAAIGTLQSTPYTSTRVMSSEVSSSLSSSGSILTSPVTLSEQSSITPVSTSSTAIPNLLNTAPSETTATSSIATLAATGNSQTYGGVNGSQTNGSARGSDVSADSGTSSVLNKGAIIAIAVSVGSVALLVVLLTVVRKRSQRKAKQLRPLNFSLGYATMANDGDRGITRGSQESWLDRGRPMSGISQVEPDMCPQMEESTHGHDTVITYQGSAVSDRLSLSGSADNNGCEGGLWSRVDSGGAHDFNAVYSKSIDDKW